MEYRNDLEAARLRINTLEAKLDESKASIEAREAELAECRGERDRLRKTAGGKTPSPRWMLLGVATIAFVLGSILSFGATTLLYSTTRAPVATTATSEQPKVTISEKGSTAEGNTNVRPDGPPVPIATVAGQTDVPVPQPLTSAATVSGQTDVAPPEGATIESVVEGVRPKVKACYREETKQHPKASGSVNVVFDIDPSGKLSRMKLETYPYVEPWWSKTFEACVVGAYRGLTFPNPAGTKTTASGKYFLSALDLAF